MDSRRWQDLKQVVTSLLETDRQEWPKSLCEICGSDVDLFLDVSSLLAVSRSLSDFIDQPAWRFLHPVDQRS